MLKSADEVTHIQEALRLMERVLADVATCFMNVGVSEKDVATEIEYRVRQLGAEAMSFAPIVASAHRGALPHARPTGATLVAGERVVVDGYCSDITRSVSVARDSARWTEIHAAVDEARQAAIDRIAPGVAAVDVDAAARAVLSDYGLADRFTHSLGHGVGLEVHEGPRLSSQSTDVLEPGMVVTVEPGVYIRGEGGIRLEDMIEVTSAGARRLNDLPTTVLEAGKGE
ncbi:MAG: M24 family metallopeptidase [Acidobacteria bacterium]|nr:M24 family metallopeptidase [Acidobacteriota bacterium]